jgi:NAD(P)-dependent dehydrogenase (short-subunit alcohol dehydrogenase family)
MSSVLEAEKTAVITGASSGIGRAAALDFAELGMSVWMIDNDAEELEEATDLVREKCNNKYKNKQQIKGRVVDVSNEQAMMEQAMMDLAHEVFGNGDGKCHFLSNNAGVQPSVPSKGGPLGDTHNATMRFTLYINLYGPIHGCLGFVPRMKEMGEGHHRGQHGFQAGHYHAARKPSLQRLQGRAQVLYRGT